MRARWMCLRMLTLHDDPVTGGMTTWRRSPPASIASTKGLDRSSLRPEWCSILSTRARTSSSVRMRLVSSATPAARHKHARGRVDPDFLHRRIVHERLERAEAADVVHEVRFDLRAGEGNRSGAWRSMARSMRARTARGSRAASMPPAAKPSRTRAASERVMASIAAPPRYRPEPMCRK